MKTIPLGLCLIVLLAGCTAAPNDQIAVNAATEQSPQPTYTPLPTYTAYPTYTPVPIDTAEPAATPLPTATPYPTNTQYPTPAGPTPTAPLPVGVRRFQGIDLAQDRGGVTITVQSIVIAPVSVLKDNVEAKLFYDDLIEEQAITLGSLYVVVSNTTDSMISVYPDQGTIIVGSEQVDTNLWWSDDVGGDYYPGVVKEGAVLFSLARTEASDVAQIRYMVDAACDEDFDSLGDDYTFVIDLPAE